MLDPDTPIAIDHCALFRDDRIGSEGTGIPIYVQDLLSFQVSVTSDVRSGSRVEFVVGEVFSGHDTMLFCVVYQPPKQPAPRKFF